MIKIDLSRCTGCGICESACAFSHAHSVSRMKSRIRVQYDHEMGTGYPAVCAQCRERYCMDCPQKAMKLGAGGQVLVSSNSCTLCGRCEANCPVGALEIFAGVVHVCDLCGGAPRCAAACPTGAITYLPGDSGTVSLASFKQKRNRLTPAERRLFYIRELASELRNKWRELAGNQ